MYVSVTRAGEGSTALSIPAINWIIAQVCSILLFSLGGIETSLTYVFSFGLGRISRGLRKDY